MHFFNLFSLFFPKTQTLKNKLKRAKPHDTIYLKNKEYEESLHFEKHVTIVGCADGGSSIEGVFIVPKGVIVTFRHLTILPTAQIYVEGEANFEDCQLIGKKTDILVTVNGGSLNVMRCQLLHSKEVGIAAMNKSNVSVKQCTFRQNKKVHLLVEKSSVTVDESEFSNAPHCFWLNNHATLQCKNATIYNHSGTQIIVEKSTFIDQSSTIKDGVGNGLFILGGAKVELDQTTFSHHELAQVWIQQSSLKATRCQFQHGNDCGVMIQQSEVDIRNSVIANHQKTNLYVTKKSKLHLEQSAIFNSYEYGMQIYIESIVNLYDVTIYNNKQSQITATDKSIVTMKKCTIKHGQQKAISLDRKANCSIVESTISHHGKTAIQVTQSSLLLFHCQLHDNKGNGILALNRSTVEVDSVEFSNNTMAHIACRLHVNVFLLDSTFSGGKSLYFIEHCDVKATGCTFTTSENVQIELSEQTTALLDRCVIENGKSYGIKVLKNSNLQLMNSQLCHHEQAQLVVNDSAVVLNNSEIYNGKKNALLIQNHSEVTATESFISNHLKPQIWIDFESTLQLFSVQLTDGHHSDLLAQNQCAVYISDSIIRNEKFRYNVQAMNHSKIEIMKTIIENTFGEIYYSENNSVIEKGDTAT